jgi:hypothetical protein
MFHKTLIHPNIVIPNTITLFVAGFTAQSEQETKLIFESAIKSISDNSKLIKRDLQIGFTLFKMINPQDDYERVYCAAFIVSYLQGMYFFSLSSDKDKLLGVKLLNAADDAMERIHRKRNNLLNVSINKETGNAS